MFSNLILERALFIIFLASFIKLSSSIFEIKYSLNE